MSLSWVWRSEGGWRREGKVWHRGKGVESIDFISNRYALNAAIQSSIGVGCEYWKRCILDIASQSTNEVTCTLEYHCINSLFGKSCLTYNQELSVWKHVPASMPAREISEAIEECWMWYDTMSVVYLACDQLWFYILKKYPYCHSITLKYPFSNPPIHQ